MSWASENVREWIMNDEGLYLLALDCKSKRRTIEGAAGRFIARCGATRTPDGARYTLTAVQAALKDL